MNTTKTTQTVGSLLRALRLQRHLTGVELGRRAGLSQSKISKIETGAIETLSRKEVEKILNILEASYTIRQQTWRALDATYQYAERRYRAQQPFDPIFQRESHTTALCSFLFSLVNVSLQTLPYYEAVLKASDLSEAAIAVRLKEASRRQDLLWDEHRTFHFILHEAALYTAPGGKLVQLAQLDRLERFLDMRRIKLGILPLQAGLLTAENSSFVIYDDRSVVIITSSQDWSSDDSVVVADHCKVFADLSLKTTYGDEARLLIRRAINYFG